MDKTKKTVSRRPADRRLVQLYSALLHNAFIKGFIDGRIYTGNAKYACVPGLNCYSCPAAVGSCPLGALQNALASAGHRAGWYALGMILLLGVILGRTICGWLCPMGLLQELLNKIPTPKLRKNHFTRALTWLKYVILAVFVIAIPLWYGLRCQIALPAFCKYICPAGTLEGAVGHLANPANVQFYSMLGILFTRKLVIMLAAGLMCVFIWRGFCRFICPLGAIYGLFNRFNVIGVRVDADRCSRCGACVRHCGMDVRRVGDRECINCGKCQEVCSQGAISIMAGRVTLKGPANGGKGGGKDAPSGCLKTGRILRGAALAVLCFALAWFNFLDPAARNAVPEQEVTKAPAASYESDAPTGHEPGELLQDFTLECYDGSVFHLAENRGRIVFINLWATYCAPCVEELPYFSELYAAHRDDIAMVAVHSRLVTEDPVEYIAPRGFSMPFATDTDGAVNAIVGGTGTLPQTIVLDRRGEVVYNRIGSVTKDMLFALYDEADKQSG